MLRHLLNRVVSRCAGRETRTLPSTLEVSRAQTINTTPAYYERYSRIELPSSAWQADIISHYTNAAFILVIQTLRTVYHFVIILLFLIVLQFQVSYIL